MAAPANCYLPKPILTLSASSSSWRCSTMPSSIFLSTHEPLVRAARQRLKDAARICCSLAGARVELGIVRTFTESFPGTVTLPTPDCANNAPFGSM
jgi:hypothetical protein